MTPSTGTQVAHASDGGLTPGGVTATVPRKLVTRSVRIRVYPNGGQQRLLSRWFGAACWLWNRALELRSADLRVGRAQVHRTGEPGDRLLRLAMPQACEGAEEARRRQIGIQLQRLIQARDASAQVPGQMT